MTQARIEDGRGVSREARGKAGSAMGLCRWSSSRAVRAGRCFAAGFLVLCAAVVVATGEPAGAQHRVERGEYLAVGVAMCVQCHTPRDESGTLIMSRRFTGARIPIASPYPGTQWATEAPALAGLAAVRRDDLVSVLTSGRRADGRSPRPPMPHYRMSREDADAIADYLASLASPVR